MAFPTAFVLKVVLYFLRNGRQLLAEMSFSVVLVAFVFATEAK